MSLSGAEVVASVMAMLLASQTKWRNCVQDVRWDVIREQCSWQRPLLRLSTCFEGGLSLFASTVLGPFHDGEGAADQAEEGEADHGPLKLGRVEDVKDGAAELERQVAEDQEARAAADCNSCQQAQPWVSERAQDGDYHGEWKGRRGQAADEDGDESALANLAL